VDLTTVTAIRRELESELIGSALGKIFQLSKFDIAVDLRLPNSSYLFVSVEPGNPRVYLIKRRMRDLERASGNPSSLSLLLKKHVSGAEVTAVEQVEDERVLMFAFSGSDEFGNVSRFTLVAQLTGVSANLLLLDADSRILGSARQTAGEGQQPGDVYAHPARRTNSAAVPSRQDVQIGREKLSPRLDAEDLERSEDKRFHSLAGSARGKLANEIAKRRKLNQKLNGDLSNHGDADRWKRFGDLLLANVGNAVREGDKVRVTDYFDDSTPEIIIEADENDSITEAAEKFFKRYTKARNAAKAIDIRLGSIAAELRSLEARQARLEDLIEAKDEAAMAEFLGAKKAPARGSGQKRTEVSPGTRSFVSSDGFEILVGKKAKDNDFLTFRIAKSLDTWMHAADYPGSHVVIRNPNRQDVPHGTLLEAAQLAAFYSQGKSQPKAAVHYTQKKFVNKPKGSAPGLVSLASFKTILVEPKIGGATLKAQ